MRNPDPLPHAVLTLAQYVAALKALGLRTVTDGRGVHWTEGETYAVQRFPVFHLDRPSENEVHQVLRDSRMAVASYLAEPEGCHPPNSWLYLCRDRTYSLEKLVPAMRRNVRRGTKELRIGDLTPQQVLAHGFAAFSDTRRRAGLTDGTPAEFERRFRVRALCPAHVFMGAWKEESLVGFLSMTEVDDWVEIEGCFSMDAHLSSRPNDSLLYSALSRYLMQEQRRLVSYGVSSIQRSGNEGLHLFKTKVGFDAHPVHRAFVLHPWLQPFANRITLSLLNVARCAKRGDRRLNKAYGTLALALANREARVFGVSAH